MNLTAEQLAKAREAKSIEELTALAKAEGMEVSAGEIEKFWNDSHAEGELADDELDNVAGGYCATAIRYEHISMNNADPRCPRCRNPLHLKYQYMTFARSEPGAYIEGTHYDGYCCEVEGCSCYIWGRGNVCFYHVYEDDYWLEQYTVI